MVLDIPQSTKTQTKTSKHKTSPLKLQKRFMDIIVNYETKINNEIFMDHFTYQNP